MSQFLIRDLWSHRNRRDFIHINFMQEAAEYFVLVSGHDYTNRISYSGDSNVIILCN
jgi:hypothetical protein